MNFSELNINMNEILSRFVGNQNLCKLLAFDSEDALEKDDIDSPDELKHTRIFPYLFTQKVEDDAISFITIGFGGIRPSDGGYYKYENIIIRILCNKTLQKIEGGCRVFAIAEEIDTVLNSERGLGIGKTQFVSGNELWANDSYSGLTLVYKIVDFSKKVM